MRLRIHSKVTSLGLSVVLALGLGGGCADPQECECPSLDECLAFDTEDQLSADLEMALQLQQQGHHEAALMLASRVIELDPDYGTVQFVRGFSQQMTGHTVDAINSYGRYLRSYPEDAQVWFNLGYAQMESDACEAAVQSFGRALELRGEFPEAEYHINECRQRAE